MNAAVWPYAIYALASVVLTVGLAFTLRKHGKVFLEQVFADDLKVARAVNSLLVTGFFMLNLGYAFMISRTRRTADTFEAAEGLIERLGVLLLSLGIIHFINMAVIWKIRRTGRGPIDGVPVAASRRVPPPPATDARPFQPAH
ncbi:MAG: hypothetical protein AAF567_17015 [Actinomycetota bacterium]